jgi:hypothetical protein
MYRKQLHCISKYGIWWSGFNLLKFETSWIQRLLSYMPFLSDLLIVMCFCFVFEWNQHNVGFMGLLNPGLLKVLCGAGNFSKI